MFLVITDRHGETVQSRQLAPNERMDADKFAQEYAAGMDQELGCTCLPIPAGCGDFRVEFRPQRDNATHLWSAYDYYFATGNDCY